MNIKKYEHLPTGRNFHLYTAILRKVVRKDVHATVPKGNMRYDQYAVSNTAAVESSIVAFF